MHSDSIVIGKVVHCKKEPFDIYIGRNKDGTNQWGNPFPLTDPKNEEERNLCVEQYKAWLKTQPQLLNNLWRLRGKTLGCWCAPRACHGDYLSYLANDTPGTLKLIVAGSRSFTNYEFLTQEIDKIAVDYNDLIIIEGEANGADLLGRRYAEEKGYEFIPMEAMWNRPDGTIDRSAGFQRNENMARIANALIAFHHNNSTGTADMIRRAIKHELLLFKFEV